MKIAPVRISFQHDKYNFQGLYEFSGLSRNEQKMLIDQEAIRQSFNEAHPELNYERELTPLEKHVKDMVASSRSLAKEFKAAFERGKIKK